MCAAGRVGDTVLEPSRQGDTSGWIAISPGVDRDGGGKNLRSTTGFQFHRPFVTSVGLRGPVAGPPVMAISETGGEARLSINRLSSSDAESLRFPDWNKEPGRLR